MTRFPTAFIVLIVATAITTAGCSIPSLPEPPEQRGSAYTPYPTFTREPTESEIEVQQAVQRSVSATLEAMAQPSPQLGPTPVPLVVQSMASPSSGSGPVQQWDRTGYWYREDDMAGFFLPHGASAVGSRVAVLDALPGDVADLYIALSCWNGAKAVVQVAPYSLEIPAGVDHAMLLIWDHRAGKEIAKFTSKIGSSPISEDRKGIYFFDSATPKVMSLLQQAAQLPPRSLSAVIVDLDLEPEHRLVLLSEFDPFGLEDALDYLGCF